MIHVMAILMLFQQPPAAKEVSNKSPITAFIQAASNIMDAAPALWDKISKFQAEGAVQKVVTGATSLETKKLSLQSDIINGQITTSVQLENRVRALQQGLREYQNTLYKFASEIDESSHDMAEDIRATAQSLILTKDMRLSAVRSLWKPNDKVAQNNAAAQVGVAVSCSKEISVAASCLANTVRDGKRDSRPECASSSLTMSTTCARESDKKISEQ
jgi:hypothetical protein